MDLSSNFFKLTSCLFCFFLGREYPFKISSHIIAGFLYITELIYKKIRSCVTTVCKIIKPFCTLFCNSEFYTAFDNKMKLDLKGIRGNKREI